MLKLFGKLVRPGASKIGSVTVNDSTATLKPVPQTSAPVKLLGDLPSAKRFVMSIVPHIRRAALIETLVFLAAITAFNLLLGDGTRYIHMPLHPFWIIVLLIIV